MGGQLPDWRYVRFFLFVPWPISVPEAFWQCPTRRVEPGVVEHKAEWLAQFMPAQMAEQIANEDDLGFVFLQFGRRHYIDTRWIQYYFEAEAKSRNWADLYRFRGKIPLQPHQPHEASDIQTFGTFIFATTYLLPSEASPAGGPLNEAFDRCIKECEIFLEAYVQTTNDFRTGFVNRSTVLPAVPFVQFDPATRRVSAESSLRVNGEGAYPSEPPPDLSEAQLFEIAERATNSQLDHPWVLILHWRRLAFRSLHVDGDYAASVVFTQTAGEVFFDAMLMSLGWEDLESGRLPDLTREAILEWFKPKSSMSSKLKSYYTDERRILGGWYQANKGNPIFDFEHDVLRLRNRIVHAGYRPSDREAELAFEIEDKASSFAIECLLRDSNRTRYPFTALTFLGLQGLTARGLFTGKVKEQIESAPNDWWQDFRDLREWISSQLSS